MHEQQPQPIRLDLLPFRFTLAAEGLKLEPLGLWCQLRPSPNTGDFATLHPYSGG